MEFKSPHTAALPFVQPQLAAGARQESPVQVSAGLSGHCAGTIRSLRMSQCSHTLMCLYILYDSQSQNISTYTFLMGK